jgi:hypothetical protein
MRLLILALLTAILAGPREAESCGPFLPVVQFSYVAQPPQDVFARGQLGILRPGYYRRYLVVAYRYLTGVPLTREEAAAFAPKPTVVRGPIPPTPEDNYLTARNRIPGVAPIERIDEFRPIGNTYNSYQNCLDDSFDRAAKTLAERTARWGVRSPSLAEWVRGQDAVFQNCRSGTVVPAVLPAGSDALLAADRRYQIAAAEFYSEQYDAAERDFKAIAGDAGSPWRDVAPLMAARTLIREGTVKEMPEKLQTARQALDAMVRDPKWANTARGLRDYVDARLDPQRRMAELSAMLSRPEPGNEFAQTLSDFTFLWDRQGHGSEQGGELTDWITAFQKRDWQQALEHWKERHSDAWLVAALASVPHDNAAIPELLTAARKIPPTAPGWASVTYYGIDAEIAQRETDAARQWADRALAVNSPAEVRNEFVRQRFLLGQGWEEFLKYGPRTAVAEEIDFDASVDVPIDPAGRRRVFDKDFTALLNQETPLNRWVDAASSPEFPAALQADIVQAGWVRAVLLDDVPRAQGLGKRLAELRPALRTSLQAWLAAQDASEARFEAVLLVLRTPGMQPVIRDRFGRRTQDGRIDDFRDNWWDLSKPGPLPEPSPRFLSDSERSAGKDQWQQLEAVALRAPDYLCRETLTWARAHPDDPRVPESLHLAVRTTRYTNGHDSDFPKQAFTLLHTRYPKSRWAALTPYWY